MRLRGGGGGMRAALVVPFLVLACLSGCVVGPAYFATGTLELANLDATPAWLNLSLERTDPGREPRAYTVAFQRNFTLAPGAQLRDNAAHRDDASGTYRVLAFASVGALAREVRIGSGDFFRVALANGTLALDIGHDAHHADG